MSDTPAIRVATPAEYDAVIALWRELMTEHGALDPRLATADGAADYAYELFADANNLNKRLLVACDGATVVGFIFGLLVDNLPVYEPPVIGYITDCMVHPSYRGRGIGARLVDQLMTWFRQRRISEVEVSAATHNQRAIAFWRRTGASDKLLRLSYQLD